MRFLIQKKGHINALPSSDVFLVIMSLRGCHAALVLDSYVVFQGPDEPHFLRLLFHRWLLEWSRLVVR